MKKSLNSDGNQFHQYKKYKHLSSYLNSPNTDTHTHITDHDKSRLGTCAKMWRG